MSRPPEQRVDKLDSVEQKPRTTEKVASESITDEPQAQHYEPKFKSFSNLRQQEATAQSAGESVAEFVLEDKERGKEFTARGERHIPRHSFMEGLQAAINSATTPAAEEEARALFSIDYIMKKAARLMESAQSVFTSEITNLLPGVASTSGDIPDESISAEEIGQSVAKTGYDLTNADLRSKSATDVLIAHAPIEKDTSLALVKPPEGVVRNADLDFAWKSWFGLGDLPKTTAPPEIFAVSAHGMPGKVLKETAGLALNADDQVPYEEFKAAVARGLTEHRRNHPEAPPLIILAICDGGVSSATEKSIAARLAKDLGVFVLGSPGLVFRENGQVWHGRHEEDGVTPIYSKDGYKMFSPKSGEGVVHTMKQPLTADEWKTVERIARDRKE